MLDKIAYVGGVISFFWALFLIIGIPIYIIGSWKKPSPPKNPDVEKEERRRNIKLAMSSIETEYVQNEDKYNES